MWSFEVYALIFEKELLSNVNGDLYNAECCGRHQKNEIVKYWKRNIVFSGYCRRADTWLRCFIV